MTPAQAQPPKQTEMPPRLIVDDNLDSVHTVDDLESENGIKIPEKHHYLHWIEHTAILAEAIRNARREVLEECATLADIQGFHGAAKRFRAKAEREKL